MSRQFKVKKYLGWEGTDGAGFLDNFGLSDTKHTPFQNQNILVHFLYLIMLHRLSKREENSL